MKFNPTLLMPVVFAALMTLPSCMGDDDTDYSDWKKQNEAYVTEISQKSDYELLTPPWSPSAITYTKWHNDRRLTAKNLSPLDNSQCDVKYLLRDINGKGIDSSYNKTAYGDSIYRYRPSNNIVGFWYLLTQMHVGDSVTCVMPAISAYGNVKYGDVLPFSTLIYNIKLVRIKAYELPE